MPWYLYLALKQLFPSGRRLTFFTLISVLGIAISVWLLMVTTGVMGGFGKKYGQMMIDTSGEIQVLAASPIEGPEEVRSALKSVPGISAVTSVAMGPVMVLFRERPVYPQLLGIEMATVRDVVPIQKYATPGALDRLDDDTVILSAGLAASLGVAIGDTIEVVSPRVLYTAQRDEMMLPVQLEVVGTYQFGHQQLDNSVAITSLRRVQDLYGLGGAVHAFNLKLQPGQDLFQTVRKANEALPRRIHGYARTWMEASQDFLFALRLEKMMVTLMMGVVLLAATFFITALLLITVRRKTREIGLLSALGAEARETAACFCMQGTVVGLAGAMLGVGAGLLTLAYITEIFHFLGWMTGGWDSMVAIYNFSDVPAHVTPGEVAAISTFAVGMATAAGLAAAWRAAALKPVEALRSE